MLVIPADQFFIIATQKYLSDTYLFLMVAVIVSPTLLLLIIQAAAFPLTWQSSTISVEVKRIICMCVLLEYLTI